MIENGVCISEKFLGLTMKPISKSIMALLKLKLIKLNLSSIKIPSPKKKKKYLVFSTQTFLALRVNL
jgi:hypothetical protein